MSPQLSKLPLIALWHHLCHIGITSSSVFKFPILFQPPVCCSCNSITLLYYYDFLISYVASLSLSFFNEIDLAICDPLLLHFILEYLHQVPQAVQLKFLL